MGYWESSSSLEPIILKNADHNIINRYFMHNVGSGIYLYPGSDNNTIQNCRIERDDIHLFHDRAAIGLYNDYRNNISIKNTKILNNEVYNFVDGFQTIRQNPADTPNDNYEGTIVDYNQFYIDETIYTDCHGNHDPQGDCAYAENAIDLKVGSENSENPVIVTNNIMWGFRKSDQTNSDLGDPGAIMPIHYNVNHTVIQNNVSFDATVGFSIADPYNENAMRNVSIDDNIFYNIDKYAIYMADSDAIEFKHNLFKNIHSLTYDAWFIGDGTDTNIDFSYNTIIDTANKSATGHINSLNASNNTYYQSSSGILQNGSDTLLSEDPSIQYNDFIFMADRYTDHPREMHVPKVVKPNTAPVLEAIDNVNLSDTAEPLTITLNASDIDHDTLSYTIEINGSEEIAGSIVLENNQITITPHLNEDGTVRVKITVKDTHNASDVKYFNVTIHHLSEGVTAYDDTMETVVNRPIIVYPYKNDIDHNGSLDLSSVEIVLAPLNGRAIVDHNGTIIYTPDINATGSDMLKYKICDLNNTQECDEAKVMIEVEADVNNTNAIKTTWGFKGFDIPSHTVTVNVGESVASAINTIKNQGGGTVILREGVHYAHRLNLPSNIVIKGESRDKSILKIDASGYMMLARDNDRENIIVKDLTIDCRNNGDYGCVEFDYGAHNILVDNIHIFGATRNNIIAWNEDWSNAGNITVKNTITHSVEKWHGIALRFIKGAIVANNISYNTTGHGIDMSRVLHGEVTNNAIIDTGYGMKFPGSDYMYIHNNYVNGVKTEGGIKFNPLSDTYNKEHFHLENNSVKNSKGGIVDWGDDAPSPHFAEFVARNNSVTNDAYGMNFIRVANGIDLYTYGDNVKNRGGNAITNEFNNSVTKSATDIPEDDDVGYTTWGGFAGSVNRVYKPTLDFSVDDVYGNNTMVTVSTTSELKNAIIHASNYSTILLNDGDYTNVSVEFPKGLHHVTIKAKDGNATIYPKGRDDYSAFLLPNVANESEQVHDINFVGFKVKGSTGSWKQMLKSVHGRWVDSDGNLHDYGSNNPKYGPYNIYFKNLEVEDLFMGLYSGLYAHDWTIDHCIMKRSRYSHFWYMMGWHLGVVNSTFEDAAHDALAIRGYYPEDEIHTYIGKEDSVECYGNRYVEDRGSRSTANGFLPEGEWTHTIRHNTFKRVSTLRDDYNNVLAIAYSIYPEDPICGAEKTYMPPQNIEISYNTIDNRGEDANAVNDAIAVNGWRGINNDSLASINGVKIYYNTFYKVKSSERMIKTGDANTNLDDLKSDDVHHNRTLQ